MNHSSYKLEVSSSNCEYGFISSGISGNIQNIIIYSLTIHPDDPDLEVYNLGFGVIDENGMNDMYRNKNKDASLVLATIVQSAYAFSENHNEPIMFTGNTPIKTRLYQIAICMNFTELDADWEILGRIDNEFVKFKIGVNYNAFLVKRKRIH